MNLLSRSGSLILVYTLIFGHVSLVGKFTLAKTVDGSWRSVSQQSVLKNNAIQASFQAGLLYELKDLATGQSLISVKPDELSATLPLFGNAGIDLDKCIATQQVAADSLTSHFRGDNGLHWTLRWFFEPDNHDLILQTSIQTTKPVDQFRMIFYHCNLVDYRLVMTDGCGTSTVFSSPWDGAFFDAALPGLDFSARYVHPLVALFQGDSGGWFMEGRDLDIGPANAFVQGKGQTAEVLMMRGFPVATRTPAMYEIRFRTYHKHWQDAVDPYVNWMEQEVGFEPLDERPQKWVQDIRSQAYIPVGDFDGLEALAKRLDPAKTLLGRMGGYRGYAWDNNFPSYAPTETSAKWFKRARELGFHVGVHVNTAAMDPIYVDLVKRFHRGFSEVIVGPDGVEAYSGPPPSHFGRIEIETPDGKKWFWGVPPTVVYTTTANKDWRDLLIERLRLVIEAGVDMIYLDESMAASGKYLYDGMTATQGVMSLERELRDAYPHIVIETEQVNPQNARWSSFALTTLDYGHPLGGYLFSRFVKFVPEGWAYSPTDEKYMDQFQTFGFMYPGAHQEPSWLEIAEAFQKYNLTPDSRISLNEYQLFGYRGRDGVIAFYEKHPTRRGLVVYAEGKESQWFGTRIRGVKNWSGPGVLADWPLFNGKTLLGLDPQRTYVFDESITLPKNQFHVTSVPDDFLLYASMDRRIRFHEIGPDAIYTKVFCTGHGDLTMHVPNGMRVFLGDQEVSVDRQGQMASVQINAERDKPVRLLAFQKTETLLQGRWIDLPWSPGPRHKDGYVSQSGDGFYSSVTGVGMIVGKMPHSESIHVTGSWSMSGRPKSFGDAVIRINGKEVLRVLPGKNPIEPKSFDVDVSAFAGQYVLFEFAVEGEVHGPGNTNWTRPRFVVKN